MESQTALAPVGSGQAAIMERVVIAGDLAKLTPEERVTYYMRTCESLGLNPLTKPFDYIMLNNKLTLYANRSCADQLRATRAITITSLDPRQVGDLLVVVATGRDRSGREDSSTGVVNVKGLTGEALANAMMKAETKAKRRLTLSLAGLGWTDETEVGSIPGAVRTDVDPETGEIRKAPSLAERVAERAAAVRGDEPVPGQEPLPIDGEAVEMPPVPSAGPPIPHSAALLDWADANKLDFRGQVIPIAHRLWGPDPIYLARLSAADLTRLRDHAAAELLKPAEEAV